MSYPGPNAPPDDETRTEILELVRAGKVTPIARINLDGSYETAWDWGVLDLNGDGKLEMVVIASGHNTSISVDEGNKSVLHWYLGD